MDAVLAELADLSVGNYLTAVLVGITAYYAWLTRQTVTAMQDQNERFMRPYVSVRLTRDRTSYILVVENTGRTSAKDLRLDIDQEFHCIGDEQFLLSEETLFREGVSTFPAGAEVGYVLGHTVRLKDDPENMPKRFTVTARYSYGDTKVEEDFKVNLEQFAKNILVYRGARRELKEIREAVEEMSESLDG
ncbi:hypothetical protein GGP80_003364 [Salinibacter ruber]|uniref:hypothetical protein n=1 Tax=Salinibacter ruber TaxID=146919 RepID=UPI00216A86FE|nr:hypothetical protein [Salinibacter ruber]MCS3937354.1 hypothetical protein [Salinibacter ruber]